MDSFSQGQATYSQSLDISDTPQSILRNILSLKCIMSDASLSLVQHYERLRSAAWRERAVKKSPSSTPLTECHSQLGLRAIGWGSCGTVYEQHGTSDVLKRAIITRALARNCHLWNDFIVHRTVEEAFARFVEQGGHPSIVHVPRCSGYISKEDKRWWAVHERLFPQDWREPEDLLRSERIPPVHLVARHALIDQFCPEGLKVEAMLQDSNKDCLIRLYLGKRRHSTVRVKDEVDYFGLRDFKLCLDQMEDLGLDTLDYALPMADALAIMHWKARIDAADVEFVLGGAPCLAQEPLPAVAELKKLKEGSSTYVDPVQSQAAATHMWLLDFNQCQPISMDENGVDQAVKRFFDNDPYYPRPLAATGSTDDWLWKSFARRYLETSGSIIGADQECRIECRILPYRFIEKVTQAMHIRLKRKAEAAKQSEVYSEYEAATEKATPETQEQS